VHETHSCRSPPICLHGSIGMRMCQKQWPVGDVVWELFMPLQLVAALLSDWYCMACMLGNDPTVYILYCILFSVGIKRSWIRFNRVFWPLCSCMTVVTCCWSVVCVYVCLSCVFESLRN
jgi:hypothetical protein